MILQWPHWRMIFPCMVIKKQVIIYLPTAIFNTRLRQTEPQNQHGVCIGSTNSFCLFESRRRLTVEMLNTPSPAQ